MHEAAQKGKIDVCIGKAEERTNERTNTIAKINLFRMYCLLRALFFVQCNFEFSYCILHYLHVFAFRFVSFQFLSICHTIAIALLQHGANPNIRNSEQKTPLDLADDNTRPVLTGEYRKDELLEAARSGAEDRLLALLTPLNVNCHASDGRKSTPLHLASGYNRINIVQILLQNGADVHAKVT